MKTIINKQALSAWYEKNIARIVLFLVILVFSTVTVTYIPYLNVFITAEIGMGIAFFSWYAIFWPSTRLLIAMAVVILVISMGLAALRLTSLDDIIGSILYALLVAILTNYAKDMAKQKDH